MEVRSRVALNDRDDLSLAYTPGVARVCEAIAADPSLTREYTWVPHTVAVVTDGTAVLGLGDIGPAAAMPVMEGKAVLFKEFGGVDAVPICLATTDVEEIIATVAR
ncbi:MAG TPA: NAD-dependent malic enzyme, partial [Nocardioides sp.]|nr:NAD-dependent malic enzyme [Nocardioides sp.]